MHFALRISTEAFLGGHRTSMSPKGDAGRCCSTRISSQRTGALPYACMAAGENGRIKFAVGAHAIDAVPTSNVPTGN
ncbi:hypothetical protein [Pseudoxanthomonas yeongjuensis]|jgi:hypothetical protein|uniref:hypothetical protein n=1 Tax=Pseudoxanthomonas yeongjuensis TaxID=377616 RepID=UPI0013910287|nr:hypothetical protein [Pseudoxanthomonas yeongjuensis]